MRTAGWTRVLLIGLFVLALGAALTAVNLRFTRSSAGGNDFLPRWVGTRLFLTERQSPYSPETSAAIQQGIYGRGAEGEEDQGLFVYPYYAMLLFAPASLVGDYALARAIWITIQEAALIGAAAAAIGLTGWKPGRWALAGFLFFVLAWFHGAKALIDGNAAILVALLLTLALWMIKRNQDGLGGALLALSTIKPHLVALLILFVLLWALVKKRRGVIWGFFAALAVLVGVSFLLQPDWLAQNIAQMLLYDSYTPPGGVMAIFGEWWVARGAAIGLVVNIVAVLAIAWEWWRALTLKTDFEWFVWTACLTLVLTPLAGLPSTSSNYSILLPALVLVFAMWQRRINSQGAAWFNMAALFIGIWALFLLTLNNNADQYREHLSLFFVTPVWLALNLYWLRWWLRPVGERPLPRAR